MTPEIRQRLLNLRLALLQQHKILLEWERIAFEKTYGRVSGGELLQLLINNEQFAWLRVISELVVEIDESLEAKDFPMTDADAEGFIAQAGEVFGESDDYREFKLKYQKALEDNPDAFLKHGEIKKMI